MENFQPPYTEPTELASLSTKFPTRGMGKPMLKSYLTPNFKRSGSVVECLTRDRRAAGSSLTGVTALCP